MELYAINTMNGQARQRLVLMRTSWGLVAAPAEALCRVFSVRRPRVAAIPGLCRANETLPFEFPRLLFLPYPYA